MSEAQVIQGGLFKCSFCGHDHRAPKRCIYKNNRKTRCGRVCKECNRLHQRDYRRRNKDKCNARTRLYEATLRGEMYAAYGGRCACCGETNRAFLTLEHTDGRGSAARQFRSCTGIVVDLKRQGWPKDGFCLLCYNCNIGSHKNGGVCPHGNYQRQPKLAVSA